MYWGEHYWVNIHYIEPCSVLVRSVSVMVCTNIFDNNNICVTIEYDKFIFNLYIDRTGRNNKKKWRTSVTFLCKTINITMGKLNLKNATDWYFNKLYAYFTYDHDKIIS